MNISAKTKQNAKNILTHWSEAEAGSNDEKTRGPKSRWTVPLRYGMVFWAQWTEKIPAEGFQLIISKFSCLILKLRYRPNEVGTAGRL